MKYLNCILTVIAILLAVWVYDNFNKGRYQYKVEGGIIIFDSKTGKIYALYPKEQEALELDLIKSTSEWRSMESSNKKSGFSPEKFEEFKRKKREENE